MSVFIDAVVAGPVVLGVPACGGECFGCAAVGVPLGVPVSRAVGALFVVVLPEPVELVLKFVDGRGGWSRGEPPFQGLVEPFDLPLGLWMPGDPFFCFTPSRGRRYSKALRPPPNLAV